MQTIKTTAVQHTPTPEPLKFPALMVSTTGSSTVVLFDTLTSGMVVHVPPHSPYYVGEYVKAFVPADGAPWEPFIGDITISCTSE